MTLDEVNSICLLKPDERFVAVAEETAVFDEQTGSPARRIARADIERCRATEAEGTAVVSGADAFLRAFIVLQGDPVVAEEELVGTLTAVSGRPSEYTLKQPPPAADQCVIADDATTKIIEIDTTVSPAKVTELHVVPTGATVPVIGTRNSNDCLVATDIIHEKT